jgi:predicted O-methyltransferase YrrM
VSKIRQAGIISSRTSLRDGFELSGKSLLELVLSDNAAPVRKYFEGYPSGSFMSDRCRVVLYELVRALNAKTVAEVGTLLAGTSEVLCRALYDNGGGMLFTTDPFGHHNKVTEIIDQWPAALSQLCIFSPKMSMDFFLELDSSGQQLDLCLVDGNHDFEFALFDLCMAAKVVRPGGVIVMDNSEQSGPFYAAREFLMHNQGWTELGEAFANFSPSRPFDKARSSVPETSFLILRKPKNFLVQATPSSTTQKSITGSVLKGIQFDLAAQEPSSGKLHVQAILRAFISAPLEIEEYFHIFDVDITAESSSKSIKYLFDKPLNSLLEERKGGCRHTLELEFSWESSSGTQVLHLTQTPVPIF